MPRPVALKLLSQDVEDPTGSPSATIDTVADGGPGSLVVPTAAEMMQWRAEADAQLEDFLARFDAAIVGGTEPGRAAHSLCHRYMEWARASMGRFHRRPVTDEQKRAWSKEQAVWMGLADLAAVDAPKDPAGVDRFLMIWLGVVHEAAATGRSWLFSE
jgi:hypothetical protein